MRDLPKTGFDPEKQTRTTQLRHGDSLAALIEQASTALGMDKSAFLRGAIAREARRVIEESSRHRLTQEDAERFQAAFDAPPDPTPRARASAAAYRARVARAD